MGTAGHMVRLGRKEMRKGKNRNTPAMPQSGNEEPERNVAELHEVVREFRDSVRLEAERPDLFWMRQRNEIMEKLQKPVAPKPRRSLLWIPAAAAVLLCLIFFAENGKAPTPDLAAGYDQELLVEVERALSRNQPDALLPAQLIIQEMERSKTITRHP
jgi:hypothetical protein